MFVRVVLPGMFFALALLAGVGMWAFAGGAERGETNPLLATQGGAPQAIPVAGNAAQDPATVPAAGAAPVASFDSGLGNLAGRAESRQVTLYLISKADPTKLVPHAVTIDSAPGTRDLVDRVVQALQGPFEDAAPVLPTVPKGTKLLSVFVMRKQMIVNLSRDLAMTHPGGTQNARLTIYSLVDTLVDLGLAEEVKLLVQGREETAFTDHIDMTRSLPFEGSVILNKQIAQDPPSAPGARAVAALAGTAAAAGAAAPR